MSHFTLVTTITLLSYFVSHGRAVLDCRDPPAETQTFFDLVELQSLSTNYPDKFRTPVQCSSETESSKCANQICCGDEVSCCYNDTERKRQICGCKAKTDQECTRGPPLAYVRTYRCEDPHSAESYTCFRKNKEGEVVEGSVVTSIKPFARKSLLEYAVGISGIEGELGEVGSYTRVDNLVLGESDGEPLIDPEGEPLEGLLKTISTKKLYILAQKVMEKHANGIPYGRNQTN